MNDIITWKDVETRLRYIIATFQNNIHKLGTSDDVVKFGQDLFLTTSQAFNCYATSIVMNENEDGPPPLIFNMIDSLDRWLSARILNCDESSINQVFSAEEIIRKANETFANMDKTIAEFRKKRGEIV